jgi:hypothetical protein
MVAQRTGRSAERNVVKSVVRSVRNGERSVMSAVGRCAV